MPHPYTELNVWREAVEVALAVYRVTPIFPKEETYGLSAQMRRAAVSVASNIAEGQSRLTPKEFRSFLGNARGSLAELRTQLLIAHKIGYVPDADHAVLDKRLESIARMLNALQSSIRDRIESTANKQTRGSPN